MTARLRTWIAAQIEQQPAACAGAFGVLLFAVIAIVDATAFGARTTYVHSVEALRDFYLDGSAVGRPAYSTETGVPRIYLSAIPQGWTRAQPVAKKKSMFFHAMLPLVLKVNEDIGRDRRRLEAIAAAYQAGTARNSASDRNWLRHMAERYEVVDTLSPETPEEQYIAPLLRRVDVIPPSIALAQAAVESGYGSSRFAIQGNALYGQWRTGGGLRPNAQPERFSDYGIATFATPLHSVAAYAHNLNTFPAYRTFRALRAEQAGGRSADSLVLAETLTAYSQLGAEYVATLQRIIRDNRLDRFDRAQLADGRAVTVRLSPGAKRQRRAL